MLSRLPKIVPLPSVANLIPVPTPQSPTCLFIYIITDHTLLDSSVPSGSLAQLVPPTFTLLVKAFYICQRLHLVVTSVFVVSVLLIWSPPLSVPEISWRLPTIGKLISVAEIWRLILVPMVIRILEDVHSLATINAVDPKISALMVL